MATTTRATIEAARMVHCLPVREPFLPPDWLPRGLAQYCCRPSGVPVPVVLTNPGAPGSSTRMTDPGRIPTSPRVWEAWITSPLRTDSRATTATPTSPPSVSAKRPAGTLVGTRTTLVVFGPATVTSTKLSCSGPPTVGSS